MPVDAGDPAAGMSGAVFEIQGIEINLGLLKITSFWGGACLYSRNLWQRGT